MKHIDRATDLNEEESKNLIPGYITTRKELYDAEFTNITEASKYYLLSNRKINFSPNYLYIWLEYVSIVL